ncbi:hypothetical protein RhiirA4_465145 [Rhizophagus irregularis]|uniref:PPM-type phosphatase domain-containing protein n=1 Tax=Rhizophagus irregularis TaxID=588596 RepID=A0A2I1GRJ0_9GLOM|nr:hypothetical protein RhiirA4_465145 [Rhizophagus irregularis]
MGEFLSEPIEDKNTTEGICQQHDLIYVTSTMQGWRKNMEDMHTVDEENIEEAIKDAFMPTDNVWKASRVVMNVGGLAIHLSVDHKPNIDRESQRIIQAGS